MTVHYSDDWLTVLHGDVRDELRTLPDESVHCVITSPPYWGLRDYGTATWEGGDPACDHVQQRQPQSLAKLADKHAPRVNPRNPNRADDDQIYATAYRSVCGKCGAVRLDNQLGLEPTPEQYVENMVAVFREVKRVLRSDGTLWLNLGDSYASDMKGSGGGPSSTLGIEAGTGRSRMSDANRERAQHRNRYAAPKLQHGLKPKDLVGIPWRVAFALQADGWYLRSDIIWSKPNPMPESVTDRPTKSHEYLFLLSKSARYYFDADAVREPHAELDRPQSEKRRLQRMGREVAVVAGGGQSSKGIDDGWQEPTHTMQTNPAGRNIRSVWTIATAPYPGAHFATFPPKLVEPCIKAGTSEKGVCPECGAPWVRVVERQNESTYARIKRETGTTYKDMKAEAAANGITPGNVGGTHAPGRRGAYYEPTENKTTGWGPSCRHDLPPQPATVLDPFAGSGTTGMVAQSLSRRAVLIDLNVDYLGQLMERNREIPLGLEAS